MYVPVWLIVLAFLFVPALQEIAVNLAVGAFWFAWSLRWVAVYVFVGLVGAGLGNVLRGEVFAWVFGLALPLALFGWRAEAAERKRAVAAWDEVKTDPTRMPEQPTVTL